MKHSPLVAQIVNLPSLPSLPSGSRRSFPNFSKTNSQTGSLRYATVVAQVVNLPCRGLPVGEVRISGTATRKPPVCATITVAVFGAHAILESFDPIEVSRNSECCQYAQNYLTLLLKRTDEQKTNSWDALRFVGDCSYLECVPMGEKSQRSLVYRSGFQDQW